MMPGNPLMFGRIGHTPVFGIPGYPVSAIVAFEMFAGHLLLAMQQMPPLNSLNAKSPICASHLDNFSPKHKKQ